MMSHNNTHTRLDKLRATFDQMYQDNLRMAEKLRKRDAPLIAKVRRLEAEVNTLINRIQAQERILKKLQDGSSN